MNRLMLRAVCAAALAIAAGAATAAPSPVNLAAGREWTVWGGTNAQSHFSTLDQITPANVANLKPVWVYDPGTTGRGWQSSPLVIDGIMYMPNPDSDILALEPETGKLLWKWEVPGRGARRMRAVSYWPGDGVMKPRLLYPQGGRLYAIDMKTGQTMTEWGENGSIDITLDRDKFPQGGSSTGSAPVVYKNLVILATSEGFRMGVRPGDPRAYDLRTGKLVWRTRLIPGPNEPGGDSWGPNTQQVAGGGSWGILSVDEATGTVFVPTDSPGPDYIGIWRPGDNKWGNSTVAIDAETGKIKWGFQTHHHDLFDWDSMAAPTVTEITQNGRKVPVVVQTTKLGMMWIFNRDTGEPVFGYEERPVPKTDVPGEISSPTQPFTLKPPPLARMGMTRDDITRIDEESYKECVAEWDRDNLKNAGPFTVPFREGKTVFLPGSSGAINWGGATVNPELGLAFTNVTNIPVMNEIGTGGPAFNNGLRTIGNFTRFADRFGRPCVKGPHGELIAVNLNTGDIAWRRPLGTLEDDYGPAGKDVGATNIGSSLATRTGLLFIGASADERFRAFDQRTGRVLWETKMSASGVATPITYMGKDGRQYVVIAAGGPGTAAYRTDPQWGYRQLLVAFALPRPGETPIDIVTNYPKRMPNPGEVWPPQ